MMLELEERWIKNNPQATISALRVPTTGVREYIEVEGAVGSIIWFIQFIAMSYSGLISLGRV
jgi:hypothetical protein